MKRIMILTLVGIVLVAGAAAVFLVLKRPVARGSVEVTLRIAVTPKEKAEFVAAQANSARFKYEIGKKAGLKPSLAQQLKATVATNNSAQVEVRVTMETQEQARRYEESCAEVLQGQCGHEAEVGLVAIMHVDRSWSFGKKPKP